MPSPRLLWRAAACRLALTAAAVAQSTAAPASGLLFYLSGETDTTADHAAPGTARPTFDSDVRQISDGARGAGLECGDLQRLAWRAPGNIYAQRGTLAFAWRSRYPVGPTEFPVFRVAYADHSSWDMVWLRIDYNGHGFDAFVTDQGLSRIRVSTTLPSFPGPREWTHLALAWDETRGLRFYINGRLAAEKDTVCALDAALNQFGPHSRIISPHAVQSDYNWVRGGDVDEIRIYNRMLSDAEVATLAHDDAPAMVATLPARSLSDTATKSQWSRRFGWGEDQAPPPYYTGPTLSVRKVEIHDAYDLKRWWWRATDGIHETTWPGVYNRSRLPGRNDYDTLPDWDCYVDSGRSITFTLPDEPWNHLEIAGPAFGRMDLLPPGVDNENAFASPAARELFTRARGVEKTVHVLAAPITGGKIRFTNTEQEQPISELVAYDVTAGAEPAAAHKLSFRLSRTCADESRVASLQAFINGRFVADERAMLYAEPASTPRATTAAQPSSSNSPLPLVHVLVPDVWDDTTDGLDGIAIDLPALPGDAAAGELIPLNVQVKDPLWPLRNLLDFTFCVKAGESKTLWLDTRDRLLPKAAPLWLSLASASPAVDAAALEGTAIRLVFKPRAAARAEHESDRFTQVRDDYAGLVESNPFDPRHDTWVRFERDLTDLLRVNPDHPLGRVYAAVSSLRGPPPPFHQPEPPAGVPLWAFRQTELLRREKQFALWYLDHRQVAYGDFGGGISDDVDLTNLWPGLALMGCAPDRLRHSLHALLEAAFKNGMVTNGLPTIQADELHSYEEGINCLAQNLLLDYGSPRQIERAMVTARGLREITGVNAAGHRHIRTSYYSGTRMATEEPWGRAKPHSYLVLHPNELLVDFNGSPEVKRYMLELADGLLAHRHAPADGQPSLATMAIRFSDDREFTATRANFPWPLFWGAWRWTGDKRYLDPILDGGLETLMTVNANVIDLLDLRSTWTKHLKDIPTFPPVVAPGRATPLPQGATLFARGDHFLWQLTGDKTHLEKLYADQIAQCALLDYLNTEGSLWIDRVGVPTVELQRARLGGVALVRMGLYPGHIVSWSFAAPANAESVALLIPDGTPSAFKVIACNLEINPVTARMTGWNVDPGVWEISQGVDTTGDDVADQSITVHSEPFERSSSLAFTLPPRATTVLQLRRKTPGVPYWSRPDLGLDPEDVHVSGHDVQVRVHSLGSVPTPAVTVALRNAAGEIVASATVPALAAPNDLAPKTATVTLQLPAVERRAGASIEIDPAHRLTEITRLNNRVPLLLPVEAKH